MKLLYIILIFISFVTVSCKRCAECSVKDLVGNPKYTTEVCGTNKAELEEKKKDFIDQYNGANATFPECTDKGIF